MENKTKYTTILIIFILTIIASGILSFVSVEQACGGTQNSCYEVQTSKYETTFGIKNAYVGLIAFPILAILTFMHLKNPTKFKKQIITLGLSIGTLFALYFIYLQLFVLKALCKYCIVVDLGMIIGLGIIILWKEK